MQLHLLVNFSGAKLIRFRQIWLDLGEILAKLIRLGQSWLDLVKI